jgi:hypothetical protein
MLAFRIGCYQLLSGEVETMHTERFRASLAVVIGGLVCSPAFAAVGAQVPWVPTPLEDVVSIASVTLPNDACAEAAPISGEGVFAFDNTSATMDGPAHNACDFFGQTQIDHDVWFCWTAPASACAGSYVVETCGQTDVDTKIAVYSGCTCPPSESNLYACRDDDCDVQTRAKFKAIPEQSYLIRMGTFPGESGGAGDFSITCQKDILCTEPENHCQRPDQAGALPSNRTSVRVADGFTPAESGTIDSVCWWGTYLTSPPEPIDCQGAAPDAFEIRYFTDAGGVPGTEIASFSQTGETLVVGGPVLTGSLINPNIVEYEFHATHEGIPATAGEFLWIEITNEITGCRWFWETGLGGDGHALQDGFPTPPDGYAADDAFAGDLAFCVNVQIERPTPPPNDNCADATELTGVGTFTVENWLATTDGPNHPSCLSSFEEGIDKDVWYRWTSPCDGPVRVRTCETTDVDSKIAVYPGALCPTSATRPLMCNDDFCDYQSLVVFNASLGQNYLLRIGTFPDSSGGVIGFEIICGVPDNPACPGTGTCCDPTGGPGCGDETCCETVCACDPVCCDVEWDAVCAAHGFNDSGCGAIDLCGCGLVCGRPDAGDCCSANSTPGCNDTACCEAVCECDPDCCDIEWDHLCAGTGFVHNCGAEVLCTALCAAPPCPADPATSVPPNCAIDARQPHEPGNPGALQGWKSVAMTFPAGCNVADAASGDFTVSVTPAGDAPTVSDVSVAGQTVTVTLSIEIPAQKWTCITHTATGKKVCLGSLPADVNGDGTAAPVDILDIIDNLNGVTNPPLAIYQSDIDRSAEPNPADILSEIDLLNGASGFLVWNGKTLPVCPSAP